MNKRKDFVYSDDREPHRERTKTILKEHPDIRNLIGRNPYTFLIIFFVVSLQVGLSIVLKDQAWWLIFLIAYCVGAFCDHTLFVAIHECAHNMIFKKKVANTLSGIFANLPQIVPSSVSFQRYHIKHHSFQGIHELDADLPNAWEARLIGNSFFGKALWLLLFPVFQTVRVSRLKEIKPIDGWILLNITTQILFSAAIIYFFGIKAFIYLLSSLFFSIGLHPLGARWIQEHFLTDSEKQETYSYYGVLNSVALNVGYHNEHHDFPSVPWNKLPQIKEKAKEHYDNLHSHKSWTYLWLRFLFDPKISLFSRVVRQERGKVALTDMSTPDVDLLNQEK
ncbi:MAG: fatty acid desaturase [Bacteroidota bacterium]